MRANAQFHVLFNEFCSLGATCFSYNANISKSCRLESHLIICSGEAKQFLPMRGLLHHEGFIAS